MRAFEGADLSSPSYSLRGFSGEGNTGLLVSNSASTDEGDAEGEAKGTAPPSTGVDHLLALG